MNAVGSLGGTNRALRQLLALFAPAVKFQPKPVTPHSCQIEEALPAPAAKKILIVDDDPIILKTLQLKLQPQGYRVIIAVDGSSAIGAVRREQPDLILLDISFPPDVAHGGTVNWDGFLIMSWLRRLDEARQIPVVVISGGDAAQYKARSLAAGAVAFFSKPLDHAGLLSLIERTLNQAAEAGQIAPEMDFAI